MNVIQNQWKEQLSRFEDGVYFPSDEFIRLSGSPGEGYRRNDRASITSLLESEPNGWTDLDELCSIQVGDLAIFAGQTSWEGAGFVAVEEHPGGRLLWLLHLSASEKFTEAFADGPYIHAVSTEYPFRCEWKIPIDSPETLVVSQTDVG